MSPGLPHHSSNLRLAVRYFPGFDTGESDLRIQDLEATSGLSTGYSQRGGLHFICMDWRHMHEMQTAGSRVRTDQKNLCIWMKEIVSP